MIDSMNLTVNDNTNNGTVFEPGSAQVNVAVNHHAAVPTSALPSGFGAMSLGHAVLSHSGQVSAHNAISASAPAQPSFATGQLVPQMPPHGQASQHGTPRVQGTPFAMHPPALPFQHGVPFQMPTRRCPPV